VSVERGPAVRLSGCRPRGSGLDSQHCQIFWVAVGLERGPLSPYEDKWGATWKRSNGRGGSAAPATRHDTSHSAKVGTKFRRQVAAAQSVYFACRLNAAEFVLFFSNKTCSLQFILQELTIPHCSAVVWYWRTVSLWMHWQPVGQLPPAHNFLLSKSTEGHACAQRTSCDVSFPLKKVVPSHNWAPRRKSVQEGAGAELRHWTIVSAARNSECTAT
jgi:hypothetical protein